jgi:hypothetical protein
MFLMLAAASLWKVIVNAPIAEPEHPLWCFMSAKGLPYPFSHIFCRGLLFGAIVSQKATYDLAVFLIIQPDDTRLSN